MLPIFAEIRHLLVIHLWENHIWTFPGFSRLCFEPVNLPVKINFWNILMLENLFCIPVIDFSLAVPVYIN